MKIECDRHTPIYGYDTRNRLTNLGVNGTVAGAPGAIASYAYTLDPSGHRIGVNELSGRTVSYGYDNLYRLTSETIGRVARTNFLVSSTTEIDEAAIPRTLPDSSNAEGAPSSVCEGGSWAVLRLETWGRRLTALTPMLQHHFAIS